MSEDQKTEKSQDQPTANPEFTSPVKSQPIWPWIVFGLFTLLFAIKPLLSKHEVKDGFDHLAFGKLPRHLSSSAKTL